MTDTLTRGDIAVRLLRAAISGSPFPSDVPDTPSNRSVWDDTRRDITNLPPGVMPDVPYDYNAPLRGESTKAAEPDVVKVGPKGYIHGWIFVGAPGVGDRVYHPQHGHGTVTAHDGKHATVSFDKGGTHSFEAHERQSAGKLAKREDEYKRVAGDAEKLTHSATEGAQSAAEHHEAARLHREAAALAPDEKTASQHTRAAERHDLGAKLAADAKPKDRRAYTTAAKKADNATRMAEEYRTQEAYNQASQAHVMAAYAASKLGDMRNQEKHSQISRSLEDEGLKIREQEAEQARQNSRLTDDYIRGEHGVKELSDEQLHAVDTELARRASVMGRSGFVGMSHRAVKDEILARDRAKRAAQKKDIKGLMDGYKELADAGHIDPTTNDPDAEKFVKHFTGTFGGLTTKPQAQYYRGSHTFVVHGTIHDPADDNKRVGTFMRVFTDDGTVNHDLLTIHRSVQGRGFAKEFNAHNEALYKEYGVSRIKVHADIDVGGYAWARQGFDWSNQADANKLFRAVKEKVSAGGSEEAKADLSHYRQRMLTADFGSADYPTPYELSQIGWRPGKQVWAGKTAMLGSDWFGVKHIGG